MPMRRALSTLRAFQELAGRPIDGPCISNTSTSGTTETTMISNGEFLHPTSIPWLLIFNTSEGQKILSSPFAATIVSLSTGSKRAAASQLLTGRDTIDRGARMDTRFARCEAFNGQDEDEEEYREYRKAFGCSGLC